MLITSVALAGATYFTYKGARHYINHQKMADLPYVFGRQVHRSRNLGDHLSNRFTLDMLVPASDKVQNELLYAEQSPWKSQVISVPSTTTQTAIQKMKMQLQGLPLFFQYAQKYWRPYLVVGTVSVAGWMGLTFYRLFFFSQGVKTIADSVLIVGGNLLIKGIVVKMIICLPVVICASVLGERLACRASSRVINDIRSDIFTHLQKLPPAFHKEARLSDLLARFSTDMEKVELAMGRHLLGGVCDAILIVISLGLMINIKWQLAMIGLLPMAIMIPVVFRAAGNFANTGYDMQTQKAFMLNSAREGMQALSLIESFGLQRFIQTCFGDELQKLEDKSTESHFGRALFHISVISSHLTFELAALVGGVFYVIGGVMTAGTLLGFMTITEAFYSNFERLANIRLSHWVEASAGIRRLHEIFQQPIVILDAEDAIDLPPFEQILRFEDVAFSYDKDSSNLQLQDVNLAIEPGQFVAFVGHSGSGKSTIFNLMMRFYDATEGAIMIDGYDLRDVSQSSLREQMGVVLQDTFIFNTTIYDNILIVKPDATESEVIEAAKKAELHNFIMGLPDAYESMAGEGGSRLSGGQKQRIAIARALLRNPSILLLDEATSNLDAETAASINTTLQNLVRQCTIIMISHDLSALMNADMIFVLNEGRIVEQGKHLELLRQSDIYQRLWHAQHDKRQSNYQPIQK